MGAPKRKPLDETLLDFLSPTIDPNVRANLMVSSEVKVPCICSECAHERVVTFFSVYRQRQLRGAYVCRSCVAKVNGKRATEKMAQRQSNERQRTGREHYRQRHYSPDTYERLQDREWLQETHNANTTLSEIATQLGVSRTAIHDRFEAYQIPVIYHPRKITGLSPEQDIVQYLQSLGVSCEHRNRTIIPGFELDVYVPEHRLAIEHHGVYWHSYTATETTKERRRHYEKWRRCHEQGIRLIQFWDHEWQYQRSICQSMLRTAVGKQTHTIGARNCTVQWLSTTDAELFFHDHHLQGWNPATHVYGLLAPDDTLMAAMSFRRARFSSHFAWELVRLAFHKEYVVMGGAERLWSHARRMDIHGSVGTYADMRVFTGNVYGRLGMEYQHHTPPAYAYYKHGRIRTRLTAQKKRLQKELPQFDPTKTEAENMFAHGWRRFWDCGHVLWISKENPYA